METQDTRSRMVDLERRNAALAEEVRALTGKNRDLARRNGLLTKEIRDLTAGREALRNENRALSEGYENMRMELAARDGEIVHLSDLLSKMKAAGPEPRGPGMRAVLPHVDPAGRYSPEQTRQILGIARDTLWRWTREKRIRSYFRADNARQFYKGIDIIACYNSER